MGINGYTPAPGTLGDVGTNKRIIVDSSKNIHLMPRKELSERNAKASKNIKK